MSFGDTDHYRELFLELEVTPHRSQLNPAQIQLLTNELKTRWNGLSDFRRNERGRASGEFAPGETHVGLYGMQQQRLLQAPQTERRRKPRIQRARCA